MTSKDSLYEQVARIGKAFASPKRLELIDLLCQGEKPVEALAAEARISLKLASAHLRELRDACLVETRRDGKRVLYRLADRSVADLWVQLRLQAEERLVELRMALQSLGEHRDALEGLDRDAILKKARSGEVVVLDVRPAAEFASGHLPHARSMPLGELRRRLDELAPGTPVVAYCRGPFCVMAKQAVDLLREQGRRAFLLTDGVAEWQARGLPVER